MEDRKNNMKKKAKRFLDYKNTIQKLKDELMIKDRVLIETGKKLDWCERLNQELKGIIQADRSQYGREKGRLCKDLIESKKRTYQPPVLPLKTPSPTNVHIRLIDEIAALQTENQQLRRLVERGDLKQHDLCIRFVRMKKSKDEIYRKLLDLSEDYIATLRSILDKSPTLRDEESKESSTNLVYENLSLKIELLSLRRDVDSGLYQTKSVDSFVSNSSM